VSGRIGTTKAVTKENRLIQKKNAWMVALATTAFVAGAGCVTMLTRTAHAAPAEAQVEKDLGGGAPTRVLLDNDTMRVTLVSFPAGFRREGGMKRRLEQLIVYVDDGEFKIVPPADAKPNPNAGKRGPESPVTLDGGATKNGMHPKGTVAWHPKGSLTPTLVTGGAYRALYIETKK
jgi:hypothetical protein